MSYNYNKGRGKPSSSKPHTAPESVKRVKSSAQILVKSFFWRLNATNALGGSSSHQRTPLFLTGVQPSTAILSKMCALLFTHLTLSGAVRGVLPLYHPLQCQTSCFLQKRKNSEILYNDLHLTKVCLFLPKI